ncbi:MAG TPA: DUF2007 domain-containing protein [Roseiflexaceae bacterium]|nr:DUF2007 domain-containing protein [Roseiflexaceae bacterium]
MSHQPHHGEPVAIAQVEGVLQAQLVQSFLEDAGIAVFLEGASSAGIGGMLSGPLGAVRVFVPASQATDARQVLAEYDGPLRLLDADR